MGCFSGRLMSAASDQKLFCKLCSPFCSFNEFVEEKVITPSYSSAILTPPLHILLKLYSCREVELPRADPLKYIASWLMSFVWPLLLGTLIMLLTMDQSYLFYIQILESLNTWVTILNILVYTCVIFFPCLIICFYYFSLFCQVFFREGKLSISGFLGFYSRYLDTFDHESSYDRLYGIKVTMGLSDFILWIPSLDTFCV